jgi:phosphoserine aminotransferase
MFLLITNHQSLITVFMERVYNFNPGPATLPLEVLEEVRDRFMDFSGMSILEISHRSQEFASIIDQAKDLLAELMGLPKNYQILFLQGGASIHFAMVPLNLMEDSADYSITGHWSNRALAAAKGVGNPKVVYSAEESKFKRTPRANEIQTNPGASYLHITTNNTIFGTEYREIPDTGEVPLIADMSSDILSQKIDTEKFALIYAGAQKNLGPAGISVVIIRDDLLERKPRELPDILTYSAHAEKGSLYNTPPVFAIFVLGQVLKWVKDLGGVDKMGKINKEKASLIYNVLDSSNFYRPHADNDSRSIMNITFTLPNQELTERFVAKAKAQGLVGLKGHRTVGGIRASIYNAFPLEGVKKLVKFMTEFERRA